MHAGELNNLARTRVLLVRARQHERACWQSVRVLAVSMALLGSQCRRAVVSLLPGPGIWHALRRLA